MNPKREIHGLDQAVVLLMFALDRVFAHRVEGWRRARKGFQMEVLMRRTSSDIVVNIRPVGLPESDSVNCRFVWDESGWHPYKGQMAFTHSAKEIAGFAFNGSNATHDRVGLEFVIEARFDKPKLEAILARDAIHSCEPV